MRKSREIAEELFQKITDPDDLKKIGEYEASQKAEEERIKKTEEDNIKLSQLARDAIINGPVGQPTPGEQQFPPAAPKPMSIEEAIATIVAKRKV
jgi:hypothetical protein